MQTFEAHLTTLVMPSSSNVWGISPHDNRWEHGLRRATLSLAQFMKQRRAPRRGELSHPSWLTSHWMACNNCCGTSADSTSGINHLCRATSGLPATPTMVCHEG